MPIALVPGSPQPVRYLEPVSAAVPDVVLPLCQISRTMFVPVDNLSHSVKRLRVLHRAHHLSVTRSATKLVR